jgi:hypothetical protein
MSAELTIATAEFARAAKICIERSERTYDRFINSRALHVAKKAIEDTEKANADKIVYELAGNVSSKRSVSKKTGKVSFRRNYDLGKGFATSFNIASRRVDSNLAGMIVNARLTRSGERPIWGKA